MINYLWVEQLFKLGLDKEHDSVYGAIKGHGKNEQRYDDNIGKYGKKVCYFSRAAHSLDDDQADYDPS